MSRPGIDRVFERRLSALVNGGAAADPAGRPQGCREGVAARAADGTLWRTRRTRVALGSALTNEHITTDYSEALIELVTPAVHAQLGAAAVPARPAPVRLPAPGRRTAVGDQHAVRHRARRGHSARAVRQLARRAHEDHLSQRPRPALRAHDAGDLRACISTTRSRCRSGRRTRRCASRASRRQAVHLGELLRPAAQLPPLRLDRAVSVRRVAGGVQVVPARARCRAGRTYGSGTAYEPYATACA